MEEKSQEEFCNGCGNNGHCVHQDEHWFWPPACPFGSDECNECKKYPPPSAFTFSADVKAPARRRPPNTRPHGRDK